MNYWERSKKADKVKPLLDDISPSFCLAKWLYVQIHLPSGLTQSCYHPPTHHIPLEELEKNPSALHNTKLKIKLCLQKKPRRVEKDDAVYYQYLDRSLQKKIRLIFHITPR